MYGNGQAGKENNRRLCGVQRLISDYHRRHVGRTEKHILVGAAKVVSTFAYGNKNPKVVRGLTFFTSASWLVYNLSVGSYAGVLCEIFTLSSVIVGIVRLDLSKKSEENA
ncbi:MAG: hypothetical protein EGP89_00490 [Ruminococcaceae bacterium]|nr:hypothetical protein [Oscillospiraceae bacterium]